MLNFYHLSSLGLHNLSWNFTMFAFYLILWTFGEPPFKKLPPFLGFFCHGVGHSSGPSLLPEIKVKFQFTDMLHDCVDSDNWNAGRKGRGSATRLAADLTFLVNFQGRPLCRPQHLHVKGPCNGKLFSCYSSYKV